MRTRLVVPTGVLAEAVRGVVLLSTEDEPWPPAQPRRNHLPAMTYCTITLFTRGAVAREEAGAAGVALPPWLVSGPRTRPVTSVNLAPLACVAVVFYPDAFRLLTGLAPATLVDRDEVADQVLGPEWAEWPRALASLSQAAQAEWLMEWLTPRWLAARAAADSGWRERLRAGLRRGTAGVAAELGVCRRQVQRLFAYWSGLTATQSRRIERGHQAFLLQRENNHALAELAAEAGFSDQAHMTREVGAVTGQPMGRLMQAARDDDAYWVYRL